MGCCASKPPPPLLEGEEAEAAAAAAAAPARSAEEEVPKCQAQLPPPASLSLKADDLDRGDNDQLRASTAVGRSDAVGVKHYDSAGDTLDTVFTSIASEEGVEFEGSTGERITEVTKPEETAADQEKEKEVVVDVRDVEVLIAAAAATAAALPPPPPLPTRTTRTGRRPPSKISRRSLAAADPPSEKPGGVGRAPVASVRTVQVEPISLNPSA